MDLERAGELLLEHLAHIVARADIAELRLLGYPSTSRRVLEHGTEYELSFSFFPGCTRSPYDTAPTQLAALAELRPGPISMTFAVTQEGAITPLTEPRAGFATLLPPRISTPYEK